MDFQQLTLDYLEGRITPADYENMIESDCGLFEWIQSILPEDKTYSKWNLEQACLVHYPYNIREIMQLHEALDHGGPKGALSYHYHIHHEVDKIMRHAFPELEIHTDPRPEVLRELSMFAVPSYIGGKEVAEHNILGKLLEDIPMNLSVTAQKKLAKERAKEAFHITGNKYPHWIQSPEWPLHNGKPMKFVKTTKINSEMVCHQFIDEESGTITEVLDFH